MSRSRSEFPKAVRVAVIKRATDAAGTIRCEQCNGVAKRFQIDHINPDGLTGKPTLENAKLLCDVPCHREKTAKDVADIAKAKRREVDHLRANPAPAKKLAGPGFAHTSGKRQAHHTAMPMRRPMFVERAP